MSQFAEYAICLLLLTGGAFTLVGAIGLVRLPDFYTRLHGPTKASTLGVGCTLIGSLLYFRHQQDGVPVQEPLLTSYPFATAPVTAHFISKANIFRDWPAEKLPRPAGEGEWAVHQADADTSKGELSVEKETEAGQQD